LTRRGHRSPLAEQRRLAEEIVGASTYRDRRRDETVNTLDAIDVLIRVTKILGDCSPHVFSSYSQGEVRTDSRAEGTLQYPERLEALEAEPKGWDKRG